MAMPIPPESQSNMTNDVITPFTKATAEITSQFRVDGLKDLLFDPKSSKMVCTPYLTPGYRFEIIPSITRPGPQRVLRCWIRSQPGNVRPLCKAKLVCSSLDEKTEYMQYTGVKSRITTTTRDWCTTMTQEIYGKSKMLQEEDAMLVTVVLSYQPEPEVVKKPGLELVFQHLTRGRVDADEKLRFVAFNTKHPNGRLSSPEISYMSLDILKSHGIDIDSCRSRNFSRSIMEADQNWAF